MFRNKHIYKNGRNLSAPPVFAINIPLKGNHRRDDLYSREAIKEH